MCILVVTQINLFFRIAVVVAKPSVEKPTLCAWLQATSCSHTHKKKECLCMYTHTLCRYIHKTDSDTKQIHAWRPETQEEQIVKWIDLRLNE